MFQNDFPLLTNSRVVFLDSASSTQKPAKVIDDIKHFLEHDYANIHRGAYDLSMNASMLYEAAKKRIASFVGASSHHEIVFTYNATYACNLIARALIKTGMLRSGDVVLLSQAEHHANMVPWHIVAEEYGIVLEWVRLLEDGTLDYADLEAKLPNARVLALTGASNVTGELLDVNRIQAMMASLEHKPLYIMDGSQRFPHVYTDMNAAGIDIFIATGHKILSDTGIGFFAARKEILKTLMPAFCGWGAINSVTTEGYMPAWLPFRHEPGTPHIVGAVSLLSALEYIESIGGYEAIERYESELTAYALRRCRELPPHIRLIGSQCTDHRLGVFSFAFDHHHPNDIAEMLADRGICVRAWHHCAEPLHAALGIGASLRASLYIYNTREDIDAFFDTLLSLTAS